MKFLISHPFNQPVANTTLWVYESFVNLEYSMWDLWCGWSGNGGGFPLSFFHLPLSITTPPIFFFISGLCGMQQSLPGSTLLHPWYSSGGSHL